MFAPAMCPEPENGLHCEDAHIELVCQPAESAQLAVLLATALMGGLRSGYFRGHDHGRGTENWRSDELCFDLRRIRV